MINITLPDGNIKSFDQAISGLDLARMVLAKLPATPERPPQPALRLANA